MGMFFCQFYPRVHFRESKVQQNREVLKLTRTIDIGDFKGRDLFTIYTKVVIPNGTHPYIYIYI